ncbi:phage tail protein [Clostridium pasteurianum]|uniref:phage tail spike protein n=1 Tax=Clostridium pasteurianum TaxID=1501 RepID=UPI002260C8BF|nr:phage tail spike protein [Clostridium pasteurianum]UZW12553.1 phage tail protein [Clostridium pasteurianum]
MICIYNKKTTKGNFNNNGLAVLNECIKCEVTEELNGDYSLYIEYPIFSKKAGYFDKYNIIKIDNGQLFRIYRYKKDDRTKIIMVWAKHIFYDLSYYFIEDLRAENCSIKTAMTKAMISDLLNTYTVDSDIVLANTLYMVKCNVVEAMFKIIERWAVGELKRDNYDIKIMQAIGKDNGVLVKYGKNIEGIDIIYDSTDIVTKLYPIGNNGLTLSEKYISIVNWGSEEYPPFPIVRKVQFDADDEPTLRTLAQEAAETIGLERTTIEVDFLELSKTKEYENYGQLETVNVGDTATLYYSEWKINVKLPVVKIVSDELTGLNTKVTLGQPKKAIQDVNALVKTATDELGNKVAQALSAMMYYSNTNSLAVSTTSIQAIYLGVTAVSNTNLTCLISIYGTASVVNTLTINIQLDNKTIAFVPKQKLQQGDNVIGIPLGIPQVQSGAHYLSINLSVDTGAFTIPAFNCQCMLDGRNLQGGLSSERPHAEVSEFLHYIYINSTDRVHSGENTNITIIEPIKIQKGEMIPRSIYNSNKNITETVNIILN